MARDDIQPRSATAADLDAVADLTRRAYAPYTALFGAPPLPVTEDYAPRIAAGEVWVLDDGGEAAPGRRLAAVLVLERHGGHAMIYSVAVAPERQGRGHASTLLRFAEERARGWDVAELRLYTNARMQRNLAIYAAKGWRELARRPHPLRRAFTIVDMVKPLG